MNRQTNESEVEGKEDEVVDINQLGVQFTAAVRRPFAGGLPGISHCRKIGWHGLCRNRHK